MTFKVAREKEVKALVKVLRKFNPILMEQATAGCLVSRLMTAYTKHANPRGNQNVFLGSAPIWIGKGTNQYSLVDEFFIPSKDPNYPGTLFSVKRTTLNNKVSKGDIAKYSLQFRSLVKRVFSQDTPVVNNTKLMIGDVLELINLFCHHLVWFKEENGLHLVIREHARTKRYVVIYIGGCFDNNTVN